MLTQLIRLICLRFVLLLDDVVSELLPAGSNRSPDDVHQRREIRSERHQFSQYGFRKLQVRVAGGEVKIDYRAVRGIHLRLIGRKALPTVNLFGLPVGSAKKAARKKGERNLCAVDWFNYLAGAVHCSTKANLNNSINWPELLSIPSINRCGLMPSTINHVNSLLFDSLFMCHGLFTSLPVVWRTTHWAERKSTSRFRADQVQPSFSRPHTAAIWIDTISRSKSNRFPSWMKSSCSTENWW